MKYRLGIITEKKIPYVQLEELDKNGSVTDTKIIEKTVNVNGRLESNKANQLILDVKEKSGKNDNNTKE